MTTENSTNESRQLIGRGSAKNLYAHSAHPEHVEIEFSSRVSVFDYGALPDEIPDRGKTLADIATWFFNKFHAIGLATAYDEVLSKKENSFFMRRVSHPKFGDYKSSLQFVPLEVIFRWGVPEGSSLLKRRPDIKPNTFFEEPLVEFSTKLEATDRFVELAEAAELAGGLERIKQLQDYTIKACTELRNLLKNCGLELWDGKFEFAYDESTKELLLVDAITPDELRVTLPGLNKISLSKQMLRMWLGQSPWSYEVKKAKVKFGDEWKANVSKPPKIGQWRVQKFASLYESFAKCLEEGNGQPLMKWVREDEQKPKVFVLGNGGRESAERWRLEQEGCEIVMSEAEADTVWVSMDGHLEEGCADNYRNDRLWTFGPSKAAAKIEWSKEYGRQVAERAGIPIPRFTTDTTKLETFETPPVVKFDGLAGGKGVVVPESWDEAKAAVAEWSAKGTVLLEERLQGFEASAFFAVNTGSDGIRLSYLGSAQDFKRRYLGDEGPNTGGMGSYSPHPKVTEKDEDIFKQYAKATIDVLATDGISYNGILYLGLMKTQDKGWQMIEYNARLGDPETQALVMNWQPGAKVLRQNLQLDILPPASTYANEGTTLCLALVREDYPKKSEPIELAPWNFPATDNVQLFESGSTTGRVAYVVGKGTDLNSAGDQVFKAWVESPWKDQLDWRKDLLP